MKLITSGCSFSDNIFDDAMYPARWPHALKELTGLELTNRGQGSGGNDWISRSIIYEVSKALSEGHNPEDLLVLAMWSGMSRNSLFVSRNETYNYDKMINWNHMPNPVSFIDYREGRQPGADAGWMLGSMSCTFVNEEINKWREIYNKHFYTFEGAHINALEHMLLLQLFLSSHKIPFMFMTYAEILHPGSKYLHRSYEVGKKTIPEEWPSTQHLWNEIDFTKWLFWKNQNYSTLGFYEYCIDHGLELDDDNFHPAVFSHRYFAEYFILPELLARGLLDKKDLREPPARIV